MNFRDKLNKLLVLGSLALLVWFARLFMINVVSDHWFGTVGITTAIFGTITYLSYKDRMGAWGRTYKSILFAKASKKATKVFMFMSGFALFFLISFSVGMHAANTYYMQETAELTRIAEENGQPMTRQALEDQVSKDIAEKPLEMALLVVVAFFAIPLLMFVNFPLFASLMGTMNGIFGGQLIHIVDIFLIQELEAIGVLIFVRRIQARKVLE